MSNEAEGAVRNWFPLESNPDVMNAYVAGMGVDTSVFSFQDVLSVEDWAVEMVPTPVLAVLMLFPITPNSEAAKAAQEALILANGQELSRDVYWMRQYVGNACGTVGILHALCNAVQSSASASASGGEGGGSGLVYAAGGYLDRYFSATRGMTPEERATYLNADDELQESHSAAAEEGQTEADMDVNQHFVAFCCVGEHLYELDGRKEFPINHGACTSAELLSKVCGVVRASFMDVDPDEYRFTLVALAATPPADAEDEDVGGSGAEGAAEGGAEEVQQAEATATAAPLQMEPEP